jgi:hypothetical protein
MRNGTLRATNSFRRRNSLASVRLRNFNGDHGRTVAKRALDLPHDSGRSFRRSARLLAPKRNDAAELIDVASVVSEARLWQWRQLRQRSLCVGKPLLEDRSQEHGGLALSRNELRERPADDRGHRDRQQQRMDDGRQVRARVLFHRMHCSLERNVFHRGGIAEVCR